MKIEQIIHPNDATYPLSKKEYLSNYTVYHGTRSVYSTKIEKKGWMIGDMPYIQKDIDVLRDIYKSLYYFDDHYVVLQSYAKKERLPSFTKRYWTAMNYARNKGGETVNHIIRSIQSLYELLSNEKLMKRHLNSLIRRGDKLEEIKNFKNAQHLKEIRNTITDIKERYIKFYQDGYPVIYILDGIEEFFEGWIDDSEEMIKKFGPFTYFGYSLKELELTALKSIPAEMIKKKIIFPNGVQRFEDSAMLPFKWTLDKYLKWYNENVKLKSLIFSRAVDEDEIDNISNEMIGKILINNQIIPNVQEFEDKNFDIKIWRKEINRRDIRIHYMLKDELEGKEIQCSIDISALFVEIDYEMNFIIFHINREYPRSSII